MAACLPTWMLSGESINTQGITKLQANLHRYLMQAEFVQPILCIADTDHQCPVALLDKWLPGGGHPNLLLRFAVSEAESWLLADRHATSDFFGVALKHVPSQPEVEADAKRTVLSLARRSSRRELRQEMVSATDITKPGSGYNLHMRRLAAERWRPSDAAQNSVSLRPAKERIRALTASD